VDSTWNEARLLTEVLAYCSGKFVGWFSGEAAPSEIVWRAHFSNEAQSRASGYTDIRCVLTSETGQTVGRIIAPSTDQSSQAQVDANTNNGSSSSNRDIGQTSPSAPNPVDEVEKQRQQLQREIDEQNAALEAQRRADAIADYESKLDFYASEVATRIVQIEQLYAERDAAYADFQNTFGIPYQRGSNSGCNSVDDFFGCIREHAAMPLFEFEIVNLESDIDFYVGLADSLVAPY
jgi:hypothetical protein